ncbi:MAG: DUF5908 family protein [Bacteroidota bacterium]
MPVEIYQLNINVNVKDDKKRDAPGGGQGGGMDKKAIIEACVEKVMEIIDQKEMR